MPDSEKLVPNQVNIVNFVDRPRTYWGNIFNSGRRDLLAAEMKGFLFVPTAGDYTFTLESDDGSRLEINGEVLDHDGLHGLERASKTITLTEGFHPITVSYFEKGGYQAMTLFWSGPGREQEIIPEMFLYHNRNEHAALLAQIARKRGVLKPGGVPDLIKAAEIFIRDFDNGRLPAMSFDFPEERELPEGVSVLWHVKEEDPQEKGKR